MTLRTFDARIATVRDAVTLDIEYDLGFDVKVTYTTRLLHPDTNEVFYTRDRAFGRNPQAKQFVREWLVSYPYVSVTVVERKNGVVYGHVMGGGNSLNQALIDGGYLLEEPDKRDAKVSIYQREDLPPQKLYDGIPLIEEETSINPKRSYFPL